ncbi:MAG: conjugal transfer protein TraG [Cytophagales bacterium]|nr:conjugal transfer protein TraG [Cytophagales bacterium]
MNTFGAFFEEIYKFHKAFMPFSYGIMTISVLMGMCYRFVALKQEDVMTLHLWKHLLYVMLAILTLTYFATIMNTIQYLCYFPVNKALHLNADDNVTEKYLDTIEREIEEHFEGDKGSIIGYADTAIGGEEKGYDGVKKDAAALTKMMGYVVKTAFFNPLGRDFKTTFVRLAFGMSAFFNQLTVYILRMAMILLFALFIVMAPLIISMWPWFPIGSTIVASFFKNIFCLSLWMPMMIIMMKIEMLLASSGVMAEDWGGLFKGVAFLMVAGFLKLMIPKFAAALIFGRDISTGVAFAATAGAMKTASFVQSSFEKVADHFKRSK